jgi:hypothetical protein
MLTQIFKPKYTLPFDCTLKEKITYLFKSYLLLLLLLFGLAIILKITDYTLVHFFHYQSIIKSNFVNDDLSKKYGPRLMLLIVFIVGPFVEELVFRLPLNLNISNIAIAISIIIYRCLAKHMFKFDPHSFASYFNFFVAFLVFLIVKSGLSRLSLDKIKSKYFAGYFYSSAIAFGLMHIFNYPIHYSIIFVYILFVLPQMTMGLFIGNIRMRYGFIWGFFLHVLINITFAFPLLLKIKL